MLGGFFAVLILALVYVESVAPETFIYPGKQVPRKYMSEIRYLDLIEAEEKIKYFYSDALFDVKEGMYFVTDQNLVLYSKIWEIPKFIVPLEEITNVEACYDDSFFTDSYIYVETVDGWELSFPLSSEQKKDRSFVAYLEKNMRPGGKAE